MSSLKALHLQKLNPTYGVLMPNTTTAKFISREVTISTQIKLLPQDAAVIVCIPSTLKLTYNGNKMLIDRIGVDYKLQGKK